MIMVQSQIARVKKMGEYDLAMKALRPLLLTMDDRSYAGCFAIGSIIALLCFIRTHI